jgi:hypothetical protein
MPRTCTICTHAEREAINQALVNGEPFRYIAERFGTSATALTRHKAEHLPVTLAKAHEAQEVVKAGTLLEQVQGLRDRSIRILEKAENAGDLRTALMGIREARGCMELLGEMEGQLNRNPVVNLYLSAEWIEVRALLMTALGDFPEARAAVAVALRGGTGA